jgi:uncharacterized zinc-type alcohol dehydrogenase-like protein
VKDVILSKQPAEMEKHTNSFDFILDTVSAPHDINALLALLKRDGTLTLVGAPDVDLPITPFNLIFKRRQFAGSLIGGIPETQEMLDFCGQHNIVSDVEVIVTCPLKRVPKNSLESLEKEIRDEEEKF